MVQETSTEAVCFDLDGTLVDPLLGVRNCLRKTCEAFGLTLPDEAKIGRAHV